MKKKTFGIASNYKEDCLIKCGGSSIEFLSVLLLCNSSCY